MDDSIARDSVLLAILAAPLLPAVHVTTRAIARMIGSAWPVRSFTIAMATYAGVTFILWIITLNPTFSSTIAVSATIGFFILGFLEAVFLVERGFSTQMLVDIHRRGPMTMEELFSSYGAGRGISWMLQKRLDHMAILGMIQENHAALTITPFGTIIGRIGVAWKKLLVLGEGG